MASADLATLFRGFPISHALLTHHELMTTVLIRAFGAIHARQTYLEDDGDSLVRWSTLYQTATSAPLLHAELVIFKPALPVGFLDRLCTGTRPFGSLLIEAGLEVRMTDRRLFQAGPPNEAHVGAWGRRHRMLRSSDDTLLCDVEERLEDECTLQDLILPVARDRLART